MASDKPDAAFALALTGGILMILSSVIFLLVPFFGLFAAIGLASGFIVLVGAIMLYTQPRQASTWGIIVIVFSVLSIFGTGGFVAGLILGIIGGALAIAWKPTGPYPMMPYPYPGYPAGYPYGPAPGYGGYQVPPPAPPTASAQPPAPPPADRRCASCGTAVPSAMTFCTNCGAKL